MELTLKRTYYLKGTNGILYLGDKKICSTIELPWQENQRRISCIPEGRYLLKKRFNPKFGDHLWVWDVPARDYILVHAFNDALEESKGCIAPVAEITGIGKGALSRISLAKLVSLVYPELAKGNPVYLTIKKAA